MYQVNLGDKILYYPASDDACIYDTELTEDVGQAGEFTFKVPPTNPLYSELSQGALVTILKDKKELWRGEIRDINVDFANVAEVYCLEDLAWLADEFLTPASITNETYAQRFIAAIDTYNLNRPAERQFTRGYITCVTDTSACNWITEYEDSILDDLRNCIAKDDGYIRVRRVTSGGTVTRYIDIVKLSDYGIMASQPIEYGYNLLDYVKDADYGNLTNVLTPYGAETDTEIYDGYNQRLQGTTITESTSLGIYGRHARTVIFDGVDDLTELNRLAAAYLTRYSQPQLTMEVKAADLSVIENVDEIRIGDSVRIIAKPFGVDQWLYLTEIKRDIQDISKNSITMSGHVQTNRTLTDQSQGTAEAVKNLPSKSSILDAAFKNVLALLNGVEGGYVTFETDGNDHITEIRIANNIDFEQATKAWRWNLAGLAYMSRNAPSDNWSPSVAMDMNGEIVANFIKAGELIANNGIYELNMATGYVKMQSGEFSGQLKAATGTISDGIGTLSLSGGDLHMKNSQSGGPGIFATKEGSNYYSCWGSVNSAARNSSSYLECPTYDIIVAGDNASDERLKHDISDIDIDFAKKLILGVKPKEFKFNNNPDIKQFGVIAQDVKELTEGIGKNRLCYERDTDNMYAVEYRQFIAPMIKVIQEQQKQIDELKADINKMKGESNG